MSLKCGIVGLPNVGKSTLFNALLKKRVALSANYPFATVEPNIGVVAVPDSRLEKLADLVAMEEAEGKADPSTTLRISRPPVVPAVVQFVDIAGLVKGASTGAGLGNKFLSHIREVDAIVHVLRDFSDPNIVREGSVSPNEDKTTVETELCLADLETIAKLQTAQESQSRASKDSLDMEKLNILKQIRKNLEEGKTSEQLTIKAEGLTKWFQTLPLLSIKPVLYVYNVSEEEYAEKIQSAVIPAKAGIHINIDSGSTPGMTKDAQDDKLVICARVEEELVELSEDERVEYLKELGIEEPGLDRLIKKAYQLLGLLSFLTAGVKEVRAWTLRRGETALRASGVIHTDFMKKFIRAEVIEYEKLVEAGSYKAAKDKGLIRTEGKEYIVRDGDVVEFLIGS